MSDRMLEARWNAFASDLVSTMFIVTTRDGDERSGCLVGFTTQVSIDPPRFLVCLSERNRTLAVAQDATHLAVHVVPAAERHLAELFGGETGDEVDKFDQCAWQDGPAGVPLLEACPERFVGEIVRTIGFGDHVGFVLEPIAVDHLGSSRGLTLPEATSIDPGHEA